MKKFSRKRAAILEKIRSTDTHPSAEWVYGQLKPELPDLSLATVYRNIAEFSEEGRIIKIGNVNGQDRYDGNTLPHTHFICTVCGKVLDVDYQPDIRTDPPELVREGLVVDSYQLSFYGKCRDCQALADSEAV